MTRTFCIVAALVLITVAAFWQAGACDFVGYDDPAYVTHQPMVNQGLRSAAVAWAFTAVHGANWHPLTSLSHMLDCTLFGVVPGPMHWVNVCLHALNAVLVFLVWKRFTGAEWAAAFVAALFAWHPLHVESVVWISERKDVLSTALWLGALLAYGRWTAQPGRLRSALVLTLTGLALLAKPMAVTLPCTLLLLDFWPLRRWPATRWSALLWEKVPLFAMAGAVGGVTLWVQSEDGATDFGDTLTLPARIANAVVSCARYLLRTFWPEPLTPFHPHPGWWPWWAIASSALLLALVSWLAWRERTRRPWVLFGWAWFLCTLGPVLGLVQVGAQAIADRYTYVPLLGIFTIMAWAGAEFFSRTLRIALAAVTVAACVAGTVRAIPPWRDPFSLLAHMTAAVGEHRIIQREYGSALLLAGRSQQEIDAVWLRGLELSPDDPYFLNELGVSAGRAGRFDEARGYLEKVHDLLPLHPDSHVSMAGLEFVTGQTDAAIRSIQQALELRPRHATARRLLAQIYVQQRRYSEARDALLAAVRDDRWDWVAVNELGVVQNHLGRTREALESFERASWIHPRDPGIVQNVRALRQRLGRSNP